MSASAALPSLFPHLSLAPTTRSTLEVHVFSPAGVNGGRGGDSPADDDDTAWWAALAGVASGGGGAGGVGGVAERETALYNFASASSTVSVT